jgi:hypothetical protein
VIVVQSNYVTPVFGRYDEHVLFPNLRVLPVVQQTFFNEVEPGCSLQPFALGEIAWKLLLR